MLTVWTALALQLAYPAPFVHSNMGAGQRYVDPDRPLQGPAEPAAIRPAPYARINRRADGEVQVHIEGLMMEARARIDENGQLSIHCGLPGHPAGAHDHAPELQP